MRILWLSLLAACVVLASTATQAQIVIPDINRDTIIKVPPPGPTNDNRNNPPPKRDPRCDKLTPAMQQATPGCH